jgi:hypothetical protein
VPLAAAGGREVAMGRKIMGWVLTLAAFAAVGCGRGSEPRFHAEAMLYLAVAVPPGTDLPAPSPASLAQPLAELARRRPDWAPAVDAARRMLERPGAVTLAHEGREGLVFPDRQYLAAFGRGFSEAELARAAAADRAFTLLAMAAPREVPAAYPAVQAMALAAAEAWGGYVYDVSAKRPVAPAAYAGMRFDASACELSDHVLVQQYPYQPGRLRMVTLGMAKFACPEVEVRDFPPENALAVRLAVGGAAGVLMARSLSGAGPAGFPGLLALPVDFLQAADLHPVRLKDASAESGERITVAVSAGETDSGDPQEDVVRLGPVDPGTGTAGWSLSLSRRLVGFDQQVTYQQGDAVPPDSLAKVQSSLPALRQEYRTGLPGGAACFVQFRRETPGAGVEMLWAQVLDWPDGGLDVRVVSQPVLAKPLAAGDRIRLAEADVVDWAVRGADGSVRSFPRPAGKP